MKDYIISILIVLIFIVILRTWVISFYNVSSSSMEPTLFVSDKIIVNKMSKDPRTGEVVVFSNENIQMCKRLVASGGDKVEYNNRDVFVNGKPLRMNQISSYKYFKDSRYRTIELSDDEYFFIGDNHNNSIDSREFGSINKKQIIGKATLIYYTNQDRITRMGKVIE